MRNVAKCLTDPAVKEVLHTVNMDRSPFHHFVQQKDQISEEQTGEQSAI